MDRIITVCLIFLVQIVNVQCTHAKPGRNDDRKYDSASNGKSPHNVLSVWNLTEYCATPDDLMGFIDYTFEKTQELLSAYDSGLKHKKKNEIGSVSTLKNHVDGVVELSPKYRWLFIFLGHIAGNGMRDSCSNGGYTDPTQFQCISTIKDVLNYYHTHIVDKDELYIYYNLYFAGIYCTNSQWAVLAHKNDLEIAEYMFLSKGQAEEYPESLPVALETIDNAGSTVNRALFNILNKKTISELEKETIKDNK